MYKITEYTRKKAFKLKLEVKQSKLKSKKIDVYKNGVKIASIGAKGYKDYPTYIKEKGLKYANKRRKLYKIRHNKTRGKKWSNSWLADQLLW
jgi:hypothetical protein